MQQIGAEIANQSHRTPHLAATHSPPLAVDSSGTLAYNLNRNNFD